ncbi:hypothetical protein [Streptomyces sp900116325]|uniref:Uncharacterized protein n=1 Tax=Streptomyces sp. 900116325 TaxID=3154295 RepID=A0ABV2UIX7_9ACTN
MLILTAEAGKSFKWGVQGIELLILAGLILVMAVAVYIWRRSMRLRDFDSLRAAARS